MANEYSTVDCKEEFNSLSFSFDETNPTATVQLSCDWDNRNSLISDILGNARVLPHATPGVVLKARNATNMIVRGTFATYSPAQQIADYSGQEAVITFVYDAKLDDVASETFEPSGEFYPLNHRLFAWGAPDGDFVKKEEAGGFLVKTATFTRTIYRLQPSEVPTGLLSYFGFSNADAVTATIANLDFDPETLLFEAPVYDTKTRADGERLTDVTIRWHFRRQGWNKYYRPEVNEWQSMYIRGGGRYTPYPPIAMGSLFA